MNRYLYIIFIEFGIIFVAMHLIIYRERSGHHLSGIKDFSCVNAFLFVTI